MHLYNEKLSYFIIILEAIDYYGYCTYMRINLKNSTQTGNITSVKLISDSRTSESDHGHQPKIQPSDLFNEKINNDESIPFIDDSSTSSTDIE